VALGGLMVRWKRLLNFVGFEVGWCACALGAAKGLPLAGPLVVGVFFCLQLLLVPAPGKHARFVLVATLLGWIIDSALYRAGAFSFPEGGFGHWLCPIWMAALWANFAGTLHFCLDWLRGRYWLASVLGAVGGPLAYYGGHRLGAMQLGGSLAVSLAVIAIEWAIATPALVYLSERPGLDGLRTRSTEDPPAEP
jgi:hypothetical protein